MPEGTRGPDIAQRRLPAAFLILVSGFLVALVATIALSRSMDERSQLLLNERATRAGKIVQLELDRVSEDIAASRGLFEASDSVTRVEWEKFFTARSKLLGDSKEASINFLSRVAHADRVAYEAAVRADASILTGGYPSFAIRPEGVRDEYFVIDYVYPAALTETLMGFDSLSDPLRAAAIRAALNDGNMHAVFVPELLEGEPGIIPYAPVIKNERIIGMTSAAFAIASIFNAESLGGSDVDSGAVVFELFDGTSAAPIRRIGTADGATLTGTRTVELVFDGMQMLLVVRGASRYGLTGWSANAGAIAGGGVSLLTIITFMLVYAVERGREQAIRVASKLSLESTQMTKELDDANKKLSGRVSTGERVLTDKLSELERSRTAMVSLLEDLTESRDDVEAARAFDDAMFASLDSGVVVYGIDGNIQRINESARRLFGRDEAEIIGKNPDQVYTILNNVGELIPFEERPAARVLRAGATAQSITSTGLNLKRQDGRVIPIDISASPVTLGGELRAIVVLMRDVTEARRVDRAKSEFVSLASHQLRTPLTAIGWYAELLMGETKTNLTVEEREYLQQIYQSNRRMSDLVNALLNVSRIEMGSLDIKPQPIRLDEFLRDEVNVFTPLITEKKITLQIDVDADLAPYPADPKILRIIVQNLLSNAIRYTGFTGSVRVKMTKDAEHLRLSVEDTGIGISEADQPKIFTKLFRGENVRLQDTEGSGLGLYLVDSILKQIGGSISYTSSEGKGTIFTVSLPLAGMAAHDGSKLVESSAKVTDTTSVL